MDRRHEALIPPAAVPWLSGLFALAALCFAWIAEYGFGLPPCELCYWQRYGYWAAIAVALIAGFTQRESRARIAALGVLLVAFLAVAAIAAFHAGIEYGWWQGFTACTGGLGSGQTAEELLATIENAPIVRCDEPAFKLFGLSMAGYNFLYALALAGFAAWGAFRSRP
jgi:disulfide bond formation protein DsbB